MDLLRLRNKSRGALLGGAIGDALGYAIEFDSLETILANFGKPGITTYRLNNEGIAEISDDTQMSLFTAEGLLRAINSGSCHDSDIISGICESYIHWYATQTESPHSIKGSNLSRLSSLWSRRAPGVTCLSALQMIASGSRNDVVNQSKGCGGVMRVAPIGIFAAAHQSFNLERAGRLAGEVALLTHKHPLSTYSSMAAAMIVATCMEEEEIDRTKFNTIVTRVADSIVSCFDNDNFSLELRKILFKALSLSQSEMSDIDCICDLGEGWVAEETLAIAIFSVARYIDNFEKCIVCSVNHSGDSDSTGAVTGNIIGAVLGYNAIPEKYLSCLELREEIIDMADELIV